MEVFNRIYRIISLRRYQSYHQPLFTITFLEAFYTNWPRLSIACLFCVGRYNPTILKNWLVGIRSVCGVTKVTGPE